MNLNELIQNAIKHDACEKEIKRIKKYKTFKGACKHTNAPYWCCWYAVHVLNGRWKEAEPIIFSDTSYKKVYCDYINSIE